MNLLRQLLLISLITFQPIPTNCNEYKGGHTIEGGEYSLGQSQWKYKNGKFIIYGGESRSIYYMLFSNLPFGSFDAFDYAPNPEYNTGGVEIRINNKLRTYDFKIEKILLVFVSENDDICHDYIDMSPKEWREFMQPYANSLKNDEYLTIREHFKSKAANCR